MWCCHAEGILPLLLDLSTLDNFGNSLKHQLVNQNLGRNNLRYPPNILLFVEGTRGGDKSLHLQFTHKHEMRSKGEYNFFPLLIAKLI